MGKFIAKKDIEGEYRFNLYSGNNEVIGRSTQGYSSKSACDTGITSVKTNASAKVVDLDKNESGTGARYEIFYSSNQYWFRLIAANGEKILSSEGYTSKQSCKNGIESVKSNAPDATVEYK